MTRGTIQLTRRKQRTSGDRRATRGRAALALLAATLLLAGCATGGRVQGQSSRFRAADMLVSTDEITDALAASPLLAGRSATTQPPMRLYVLPAENRSSERLSRVDGSVMMSMVALDPRMMDLLRSKNVEIYYPDDTEQLLKRFYVDVPGGPASMDARPGPTHFLTGEVRSITRQAGQQAQAASDARSDLFSVTFRITDATSNAALWAHDVLVRRVAHGVVAD